MEAMADRSLGSCFRKNDTGAYDEVRCAFHMALEVAGEARGISFAEKATELDKSWGSTRRFPESTCGANRNEFWSVGVRPLDSIVARLLEGERWRHVCCSRFSGLTHSVFHCAAPDRHRLRHTFRSLGGQWGGMKWSGRCSSSAAAPSYPRRTSDAGRVTRFLS